MSDLTGPDGLLNPDTGALSDLTGPDGLLNPDTGALSELTGPQVDPLEAVIAPVESSLVELASSVLPSDLIDVPASALVTGIPDAPAPDIGNMAPIQLPITGDTLASFGGNTGDLLSQVGL
ncbi:MAG: hypothetical protein ACI9I0_001737 [Rhodoferax sp.]